jgi:hypothetical protein
MTILAYGNTRRTLKRDSATYAADDAYIYALGGPTSPYLRTDIDDSWFASGDLHSVSSNQDLTLDDKINTDIYIYLEEDQVDKWKLVVYLNSVNVYESVLWKTGGYFLYDFEIPCLHIGASVPIEFRMERI